MTTQSKKQETQNLRYPTSLAQLSIILQQIHGQSNLIPPEKKNLAKYSNLASIFMVPFVFSFNFYAVFNKKTNLSSHPYFMKISAFLCITACSLVANSFYQMYQIKHTVLGPQIVRQKAVQQMIKVEEMLQQQKNKAQEKNKKRLLVLKNLERQAQQARLAKQTKKVKPAQSKAEKVI